MITAFSGILLLLYAWLFRQYTKGWKDQLPLEITNSTGSVFVSVIIAARNEQDNVRPLIESLKSQTYPRDCFEIIIVDDHSSDRTRENITSFGIDNLVMVEQDKGIISKKKAIEKGISISRGELIVTTDADCFLPSGWLTSLAGFYEKTQAHFIAAPVKFTYSHSHLQKFQALDFMMLQGLTASGIALDLHYMCNGANLAFTKKAFDQVNGYSGIDRIATGDDMLLMHKIKKAFPGGVRYLKSTSAIVKTLPMQSWKEFFMQRKRWASKTFVYDDWRIIAILAFVYMFNTWFFVLLITGFYNPVYFIYFFLSLLVKAIVEWSYMKHVSDFYKEKDLLPLLFIYQPIHIFYTVIAGAWSQLGKYEWKGRKTK